MKLRGDCNPSASVDADLHLDVNVTRRQLLNAKADAFNLPDHGLNDFGKPSTVRALDSALADVGAKRAYLIDKDRGMEALHPNIERRGFPASLNWLP